MSSASSSGRAPREPPAVHRDDFITGKSFARPHVSRCDAGVLGDGLQQAASPRHADTARHRTVLRKRIGQPVAGHGEAGVCRRLEKFDQLRERLHAVEIIGVDDGEIFPHRIARAPHGMARAPGLLAAVTNTNLNQTVSEYILPPFTN